MRFTIISHACLYVEHGNERLLVDPWIAGTAYWRSWANLPEPPAELVAALDPTAIYLTHCHWDHCHGPSMRRFGADVPVYVADAPSMRLEYDLRGMGRRDVRRIPHGRSVRLGGGLTLWSWQFGIAPVDSICGVRADDGTPPGLLDVNDCKAYGAPLRRILRDFGRPEVVLRAHTSANAVPYCIVDGDDESRWPRLRPPGHYRAEWWAFARACGCDVAVPFASNHSFVHDETVGYNALALRAHDIESGRAAARGPRCWLMPPGSYWDEREGLRTVRFTADDALRAAEQARAKYRGRGKHEDARAASDPHALDGVTAMCEDLARRMPALVRGLLPETTMRTTGADGKPRCWRIDWRRRRVSAEEGTRRGDIDLELHPRVLSESARYRMGGHIGPSKRVRIRLEPGTRRLFQLRLLLCCWEMADSDLLPLSPNLRPWRLRRWMRRWREGLAAIRLATTRSDSEHGYAALWKGGTAAHGPPDWVDG